MSVTVTLNGNITVIDSTTGAQPFTKQLSNLYFTGDVSEVANTVTIGTGTSTISLPLSPTQFIYLKNLSGSNSVTPTVTPNGGSAQVLPLLEPGGFVIYGNSNSGAGITGLSLTASASATIVEYILVG